MFVMLAVGACAPAAVSPVEEAPEASLRSARPAAQEPAAPAVAAPALPRSSRGDLTNATRQRAVSLDRLGEVIKEPRACEVAARNLMNDSAEDAWRGLRSCIAGTAFTDLRAMLAAPWIGLVRTSPDGLARVTEVIARRGGVIEADLKLVRQAALPLYSIGAAADRPESYKGQRVVARARMDGIVTHESRKYAAFLETRLRSDETGPKNYYGGPSSHTTEYTNGDYSSTYTSYHSGSGGPDGHTGDNHSIETGQLLLVPLSKTTERLTDGEEIVMFGRFDGLVQFEDDERIEELEDARAAVVSDVRCFHASPLLVY